MKNTRYKWQPLQRATAKPPSEELIEDVMRSCNLTRDQALVEINDKYNKGEIWINDTYQVMVNHIEGYLYQLNIRRRDGGPILRDWRHFQQIKNQLIGEECEGVELYPAESRKVDTSNKFHIWCVKSPEFRFPFGFEERAVENNNSKVPGLKQRPF